MKKINFFLMLVVLLPNVAAFQEPYTIDFPNQTSCKEALNIASREDSILLTLPPNKYCRDASAYLYVDGVSCGSRNWENVPYKSSGDHYTCMSSFRNLYELNCGDWATSKIREPMNKKWNIKFGYDNPMEGPYIENISLKIITTDDVDKECLKWEEERKDRRIILPFQVFGGLIALFGVVLDFKKKYRIGIAFNIMGILISVAPAILKLII